MQALSRLKPGLRWFFVVLLAAAAAGKLADMRGFGDIVASYRVLPEPLRLPASWALVVSEALLAAWLAFDRQLPTAALALAGLHLIYLAWVLAALARGLSIANCGCFGIYFGRPLSWTTPLEDAVLIAMSLALYRAARVG